MPRISVPRIQTRIKHHSVSLLDLLKSEVHIYMNKIKDMKSNKDRLIMILKSEEASNANTIMALTNNITAATNQINLLQTKLSDQTKQVRNLQTVRNQEQQNFRILKVKYDKINRSNNANHHAVE